MKKRRSMKMKIIIMALLIVALGAGVMVGLRNNGNTAEAAVYTDTVTGITWNYTVDSNGNATGVYTSSDFGTGVDKINISTLTIPSKIKTYPVVSIGTGSTSTQYPSSFFMGAVSDTISFTIAFETGSQVTTINPYAFYNCTTITSVALPESVTEIGSYAFYGCTFMKSISGMNNVTTLGDYAFKSCNKLDEISLDKVTGFGSNVFDNCRSLTLTITNPNMDLTNQDFEPAILCGYANSTARDYYKTKYEDDSSWLALDGDGTKSFKVSVSAGDGATLDSGMFMDTYYGITGGSVETLTSYAIKPHYTLDGYYLDNTCYYKYDATNKAMKQNITTFPADYTSDTMTLTATFVPEEYTIHYHLNGGTFDNDVSEDILKTTSEPYTYAEGKKLITKVHYTGYDFAGWYPNLDKTSSPVTEMTKTDYGSKEFWAKWTPHTYSIAFNGNGSESGSMEEQSMTYDVAKALSDKGFTKTGYTFTGWNTKANGSGTAYQNKEEVKNLSSVDGITLNLYAQWSANERTKYTVNYVYQGLSSAGIADYKTSFTYYGKTDTKVTPDASSELVTRDGFTAPANQTITITGDGSAAVTYLYTRNKYNIKVNTDVAGIKGVSGDGACYYGQLVTVSFTTMDGYSARGLKPTDESGIDMGFTSSTSNSFKFTMPYNDVVLDPSTDAKTYTVTLELNGGANNGSDITGYTYGDTVSLPVADDMLLAGFVFDGWYANADFEGDSVSQITPETIGNKIYYAKWKAGLYSITLDTDGGVINSGNVTSYKFNYGATLPTEITKHGYSFIGWWDGFHTVSEIDKTEYGNKSYVALWQDNSTTGVQISDMDTVIDTEGTNSVTITEADAVDTGYYYTKLNDIQKKIYASLFNQYQLVANQGKEQNYDSIILSSNTTYTHEDVANAQTALVWDHPEIFWVRYFGCSDVTVIENQYLCVILPMEAYSKTLYLADLEQYSGYFTKALQDIGITGNETDYQKIKSIHDYIVSTYSYDNYGVTLNATTSNDTRSAGRMLVTTRGCCEAYARLTKIFCDYYDIPCVLVKSSTHMWNEVQINGIWYGMDTTWDDNTVDSKKYFLKGQGAFSDADHQINNAFYTTPKGEAITDFGYFVPPAIQADYIASAENNNDTSTSGNQGSGDTSTGANNATGIDNNANTNINQTPDNAITIPSKNTVATVGSLKYKVTKSATKNGTVSVCGVKSKSIKGISVPATVKISGYTFKVTAVADNAFKGCKKVTKATISTNVTSIGKNAFSGDKKLKVLTIKSTKLTKVGTKAVKGIYKKATIKVPKSKKTKYKKLFVAKTGFVKNTMRLK